MSRVSDDNPLLNNFDFPPYDTIVASHMRPGMCALLKKLKCLMVYKFVIISLLKKIVSVELIVKLLKKLDGDLVQLEKTVEPPWPKLVEPLEKMMDRLTVVWGAVNHLQAVKDTPEIWSAIEEIQVCFYWFWFV
ncbi:putative oligopeptidase A [Helianthus annuus]|nr:putative oligopeptidase A [Helianthus annuus]